MKDTRNQWIHANAKGKVDKMNGGKCGLRTEEPKEGLFFYIKH